jgi:type VI secretion system protein ImpJ
MVMSTVDQTASEVSLEPANAIPIPLELKKFGIHLATLTPELKALLGEGQIVLAARSTTVSPDIIGRRGPHTIMVAAAEEIAKLIGCAFPGIRLQLLAEAPRQLPALAGTAYFALDRAGPRFDALARSAGIALHVLDDDWRDLALELWAIRAPT